MVQFKLPSKWASYFRYRPHKNNRGIAMIIAITSLVMILYFAMEVSYESNIEYIINTQSVSRIKAYYATKSAVQMSLLRIKIYQTIKKKWGQQLGSNASMLDQIWQFPLAWPMPIPDELNAVDKDAFKKINKESSMDATFLVTIEDEGSKIDINDLVSKSKTLQANTKIQIKNIFEQKMKSDEIFAKKYNDFNFDKLINEIIDWMSTTYQSLNGGDKRKPFNELNSGTYRELYPPNRPLRTLAELRMIPSMNDELFDLLSQSVTIYGMKGINPNSANKDVLLSLDPGMNEEVVKAIIERRENPQKGGSFKEATDFWNFVISKGAKLAGDPNKIPLIFDSTTNFKIRANGSFANVNKEITVITMDIDQSATAIKKQLDKEKTDAPSPRDNENPQSSNPNIQNQQESLPKGPPRIVYWSER